MYNSDPIDYHDFDKDASYLRRRNWLLKVMKKTNWEDDGEEDVEKVNLKPKLTEKNEINKNIDPNKFFKFNG